MEDHSPALISVVVVAHQRREFLAEALRSIERQTLPKDRFEVFLLKDFDAPELGPQLGRLGATVVQLPSGPLGSWVREVAGRLQGELVAFLDDDDLFEPEKLARVAESFRGADRAVYLHHASRPLGRSAAGNGAHESDRPAPERYAIRSVPPEEWRGKFLRIWRRDVAFNLSSIVVRRRVLEAFPDVLPRVQVSLSAFLFFAALRLDGTVLLDGRPLVRYRREEGFGPWGAPMPRSALRLSQLARPRGADAKVLLDLVAPLRLSASEGPLQAAVAEAEVVVALEEGGRGKRRILAALWTSVRYRPWAALLAERAVFGDALLLLVAPRRGHRAWERHCGRAPRESHPG